MMISVFDRVENIVGKGEDAGYQHLLLFPECFQKASFLGSFKVEIVWKRVRQWSSLLAREKRPFENQNGYQHYFLFLQCFQKASSTGS